MDMAAGNRPDDGGSGVLAATLAAWVNLGSWSESADFLAAHPELLTETGELTVARQLCEQTDRLALRDLQDHAMLLRASRLHGVEQAFRAWAGVRSQAEAAYARRTAALQRYAAGDAPALGEAITAASEVTELLTALPLRHQEALVDEAGLLVERFRIAGADGDLHAAVARLLTLIRRPVSMPLRWTDLITSVVVGLRQRHERTRDPADLDAAVDVALRGLQAAAPDSQAVPVLVTALGEALRTRHHHGGADADLDAAIRALQQAAESLQEAQAGLAPALDNLGGALAERFQKDGDPADLDHAIASFEKAVDALPPDAPARPGSLANLAGTLLIRYDERSGAASADSEPAGLGEGPDAVGDLDRAVARLEEAARLLPPGSRLEAAVLGALTGAWRRRYERTSAEVDLDHAVRYGERAVAAARPGTPDRASHLVELAVVRQLRASRTGDPADQDRAVQLCQEAVADTPKGSFRIRDRVNSLGIALLERYLARGSPQDLDEALRSLTTLAWPDEAVSRLSPNDASLLFNTGNGLWIGYKRTGDLTALDQAIARFGRAAGAVAPGSRDRARGLNSLAVALAERYASFGVPADLNRAMELERQALAQTPPESPEWLVYVANFGTAARLVYELTRDRAMLDEAVGTLDEALRRAPPTGPRHNALLDSLGTALAARYARTGDEADLTRAHGCLREAVDATASSPEHSLTLGHLGRVLSDLHARGGEARFAEEAVRMLRDAVTLGLRTSPQAALDTARFWGAWAERNATPREAADAFEFGMRAAYALFRAQVLRSYRRTQLRASGDVHIRAAWNRLAQAVPQLPDAVVAVERGRALLLSETLAVRRAEVDRLGQEGRRDLADRYTAAVARLAELSRIMPES
jgi:tetratricopeptide (TPR) repeat protein